MVLTAGQAGDMPVLAEVMSRLRVPRRRGRPRTRPDMVLADTAYSSRAVRDHLRRCGIGTVIPVPADQEATGCVAAAGAAGRPPSLSESNESSGVSMRAQAARASWDPI
ncbi:hypothetical protein [Streptomyces sp. NBC_01433]|uniref:hypothetical protein n=1 Tax=Streptomyces sp. NBC_01433 TaxID=2903864 RepID=UPI00338DCF78